MKMKPAQAKMKPAAIAVLGVLCLVFSFVVVNMMYTGASTGVTLAMAVLLFTVLSGAAVKARH